MANKRKPQQTPGIAYLPQEDNDDFTVPATLYCDALVFLSEACDAEARGDRDISERNLRATLFSAFAALEAQLNQAARAHAHTHREKLDSITLDILEECESTIDEKGNVVRRTKFFPFEARFSFIVHFITGKEFARGGALWQGLKAAKALRDSWTHPKPPFDSWSLNASTTRHAVTSIRDTIKTISTMLGVSPPPWLIVNEIPAMQTISGASSRPALALGTRRPNNSSKPTPLRGAA